MVDKAWKEFDIFKVSDEKDTSAFAKGTFLQTDIDTNGLTDLLIDEKYLLAFTNCRNGITKSIL